MMRHALDASELERRRIAQELHDGVIQDMAGICFALPTVERQLGDDAAGREARRTVRNVTELVHKDASALRSMLIDLLPPDLGGAGFAMAMEDIARDAREHGIEVHLDVEQGPEVPHAAASLAYRVVREGMRNVVKHAAASTARVSVRDGEGSLEVTVSDDGKGLDTTQPVEPGHLGLQLLSETVADFGGSVALAAGVDGGTVLRATIPRNLIPG
jgi:signal transduction histidine kinase